MTDIGGRVPAPEPEGRPGWLTLPVRLQAPLGPKTVWSVAGLVAAFLAASFYKHEGAWPTILFTSATTLALTCLIILATRRVLVSVVLVLGFVTLVNQVAAAKREMLGMVLHAYDIVFYLGSWSTIAYMWFAGRAHVLVFACFVGITFAAAWIAWRWDATRVSRRAAASMAVLSILIAAGAGFVKPERRQTQFYWDALYLSSFYESWAETLETLWRGQLIDSAAQSVAPTFPAITSCDTAQKPPHIFLIHQESIVQPSLFPKLGYDRSIDPFFRSHDGATHKLRVETYGGASWLTEFSILTGLSTHSFGGMRPFVQSLLAGKVGDTLPQALERCGYRNVVFYPMLKNFVSNSRFYDAIGLKEIYDLKAQGAKTTTERDAFYYANAVTEMERHVAGSSKPLFTYIQTMSAHWPYDYKFAPDMNVPGGAVGTDPEMSEYLRRAAIAKIDYDAFKADLLKRLPGERILLVHYGDHHPMATRTLLGFRNETDVEDVQMGPNSIGFQTYYAVEALNFSPPSLPLVESLDVAYLGALILQQANLPLSAPYRERLRLLEVCHGRYYDCHRPHEILSFHRRLIDSRLIDQR